MAMTVRKNALDALYALVSGYNEMKREFTRYYTTQPHADVTSKTTGSYVDPADTADTITAANATDLATGITLANEAKGAFNRHCADAVAHLVADTVNTITSANASTQGTLNTLLNELKADFNTHMAQAGVHFTNEAANTIVAADSTDLASSQTLATAVKAAYNAHIILSIAAPSITLVDA